MGEKKRDRSGEPFQDDFTENEGARRPLIEQAQHELQPDTDIENDEPVKDEGR